VTPAPIGPLDPILRPRAIAVVGASRQPGTIGNQLVVNLVDYGYTGIVYPVNTHASAVHAIRAYPTVSAIGAEVDMAVIAVPKQFVVAVAEDCARAGVRGIVVISAGFREVGPEGAERERALVDVVTRTGMRMVGPNCMGVLNADPAVSMNATFAPLMPPVGGVAFVSQSGAMGLSVLDYAREYGIGISQFVSVGNKPDVSGNDLLEQWENDPAVSVILMYTEDFGNPQRFRELASRITKRKPIIALKSGRSVVGARAASSHTGALAASDAAVEALLGQAGVLRAGSVEELFDMAMAFGRQPLPRSRRTAVLTNAGGPGILAADALEASGMTLPALHADTVTRLTPLFPPEASIRNPLDMIASATPAGYRSALGALLADPGVDSVVAIFIPPLGIEQEAVAEAMSAAAAEHPDTPVLAVLMGRNGLPQGKAELHDAGIPAYLFPEAAARALAAMCRQREWLERLPDASSPLGVDRARASAIIERARSERRSKLSEIEALALLDAYGIATAPAELATSATEAAAAATRVGLPVAMKIVSPDISHKTDVGGVRLGLTTAGEVRDAFARMMDDVGARASGARVDGVVVQRMVRGGRETIAGVTRDRLFGPLVMFGLGGILVEAVRDVVFRLAPLGTCDATDMVAGIRGAAILSGIRGEPPADRDALVDAVRRVAQLAVDFPEIEEMDVNPLLAFEHGATAVDARVRIHVTS
jgi:acetyl coenzyme A synthetase (ADP forming)-like protein